jgi:sialic acid synthase SpsE
MAVRIIAELCQNHLGDFERVKDMASQAVEAGATHVKIQHIYTRNLTFRSGRSSRRAWSGTAPRCASVVRGRRSTIGSGAWS